MMTHQQQLQNPKYRDWVKSCLSFRYMRDGIQPHVEKTAKDEHKNLLQKLGISAGQMCISGCSLTNLKPDHTSLSGRVPKCPLGQKKCNCLYPGGKRSCPNKICSRVYDEIVRNHVTNSPFWDNSDISKWCTDYWEIAKCFINTPGYAGKTASDTDITGIFQIYINNIAFRNAIRPLVPTILQTKNRRNKLFHSSKMEIEEADLKALLTDMNAILKDVSIYAHTDAQTAVKKLQELQNHNFIITMEDAAEIFKASVATIESKLTDLELKEQHSRQTVTDIKAGVHSVTSQLAQLQSQVDDHSGRLDSHDIKLEKHEKQLDEYGQDLDTHTKQLEKHEQQLEEHEKQLDTHEQQLDEHKQQLDKHEQQLDKHKQQLDTHKQQLDKLEQQLDKHEQQLYKHEEQLDKHLEQLDKHQDHVDKHEEQLDKHEEHLDKHEEQLDRQGQQLESNVQQIAEYEAVMEMLKKEIQDLKDVKQNRRELLQMIEDTMKLRALFSDRYVKTSRSPLQSTGDVDISTVYAPPDISREVEEQSPDGKREKTTKQVTKYREIFSEGGKVQRRIYLIGDVGSGKSAFCKSMIKNWCTSRESPETEDERAMAMFDYLFYIPLRTVRGDNDVEEIVTNYYKMIFSKGTINNIFHNTPNRCLVLLDGLDEWLHEKPIIQPEHETVGLPVSDSMPEVTILTTSRPSAPGILNMKKYNYDLSLTINGVCDVNTVVEKYRDQSRDNATDIYKFLMKTGIEHFQKTPLLLQQIVWLFNEGINIGTTVSDLYSTLVNAALRWNVEKNRIEPDMPTGTSQQLLFPEQLVKKFPSFRKYKKSIACLCKMSFDIYTTGSQLSFGEYELEDYGINKQLLGQILHTGLLTEELRNDPSAEKTQFSFTHLSFLEYFCALDISSHLTTQETTPPLPADTGSSASRDIFSLLQDKCRSVEEVLRLKNVLVLVCGLSRDKILAVCQLVYNIMQQDEHFLNLRKQACRDEPWQYLEVAKQYQQLVFRCIREYKLSTSISEIRVPLLDVVIEGWTENEAETVNMTERHIDHMIVRSLYILGKPDITLTTFVKLETIIMIRCNMSHAQSSSLAEYITRTVTLKNIKLYWLSCSERTCCHVIDLSRHEQLQSVWIEWTKNFSLNNINTTNLEYCYVSWTSGITFSSTESTKLQYIHIDQSSVHVSHIRLINQSVLLKHIELEYMELAEPGRMDILLRKIDLSRHDQLETFKFRRNKSLHVDSVNTSKLVHCKTDNREVLSCVRNAAVLEKLELWNMQYNMEVHEILLTLPQLHTLTLQWMDMSRDVLDVIVNDKDKFLPRLTELDMRFSPSVSDVNRFVQTLPQLQKLTLRYVDMRDDVLEVSPGMKHLTHITLNRLRISSSCWIRFVDSLLTLHQPVTVVTLWLYDREADAAEDYVRKCPEKYRILKDEPSGFFSFNFVTVKSSL